jgi:hypothetical protein
MTRDYWVDGRESNPYFFLHREACCRYTTYHISFLRFVLCFHDLQRYVEPLLAFSILLGGQKLQLRFFLRSNFLTTDGLDSIFIHYLPFVWLYKIHQEGVLDDL